MRLFKSGLPIFLILTLTTSIFCVPTTQEKGLVQSKINEEISINTKTKENILYGDEGIFEIGPQAEVKNENRGKRSPQGFYGGGDYNDRRGGRRRGGAISAYEEGRREGYIEALQNERDREFDRYRPYNGRGYYRGGGYRERDFDNRRGGDWRDRYFDWQRDGQRRAPPSQGGRNGNERD